MQVTANEAGAALRDVEQTGVRTRLATGYRRASGFLIIWGLVWLVGYTATGLLPPVDWGLAWLPLIAAGSLASIMLARRAASGVSRAAAGETGRSLLMALAIMIFIAASDVLIGPARVDAILAFPALVAALVYVLSGALMRAPRLIWIGATIFVIASAGWVAGPAVLPFALAIGGGGGLILGGLWLRQP